MRPAWLIVILVIAAGGAIAGVLVVDSMGTPKPTNPIVFSNTTGITVSALEDCGKTCKEIDPGIVARYPLFETAVLQVQRNLTMISYYPTNTTLAFAMSDDLVRAGAFKQPCFEGQCHELRFSYNGTNYRAYFDHPTYRG